MGGLFTEMSRWWIAAQFTAAILFFFDSGLLLGAHLVQTDRIETLLRLTKWRALRRYRSALVDKEGASLQK